MNLHVTKIIPDDQPAPCTRFSPWACLASWIYVAAFWAIVLLLIF